MKFPINKLALVSLLIALFGGVPGAISIIDYFNNRPGFVYHLDDTLIGEGSSEDNVKRSFIVLFGSITNSGKKALMPADYELEINNGGKWLALEKALVYKTVKFDKGLPIDLGEARKHDFQKTTNSILPDTVAYGCLMFTSPPGLFDQMSGKKVRLRLTCVDTNNERYPVELDLTAGANLESGILPRYGVVFPEQSEKPKSKE